MAVAEVICGSCGAINRAGVDTCWRCLDAIDDAEPSATEGAPVRAPLAMRAARTATRRAWPSAGRTAGQPI
jgi:hypothetical protein